MPVSFDICEVYETLMGESGASGWPCTLVRMGGCNLRCSYCDTRYALNEHTRLSLEEVLSRVHVPYPRHVLVTGGEPLIQPGTPRLLEGLVERGHTVYLETNGSMDVSAIDRRVRRVIDMKCPGSGESDKNRYQNLDHVNSLDEVKFVIGDREDFLWAKGLVERSGICTRTAVLFSPVSGRLEPRTLAEWILQERIEVRFQVQLHRILWGERRGV